MRANQVALRPKNEASRRSGPRRLTTNYFNQGSNTDNLIAQRAQCLIDHHGLSDARALLIAGMAWGGDHA